jgi:hypothetical protein
VSGLLGPRYPISAVGRCRCVLTMPVGPGYLGSAVLELSDEGGATVRYWLPRDGAELPHLVLELVQRKVQLLGEQLLEIAALQESESADRRLTEESDR